MKHILLCLSLVLLTQPGLCYDFAGELTGENVGDQFGEAMCSMDFNGDTYPDLVVSAPALDGNGLSSGRVYIYFGGPSADLIADMTLTGPTSSFFGQSMSPAGDFNDDSYQDLIVGAPFYDLPAQNAGAAYVFFGGPAADTIPDHQFVGEAEDDYFGISVTGTGDYNDDQIDDIAVGAYQADFGSFTNSGKVYVYYGGVTPKAAADKVLIGDGDGERFGYSLSAGDFSGNGVPELAVGAYSNDGSFLNAGRVYLFEGGNQPDGIADLVINGHYAGAKYGWKLTSGKFTADIYDDLIMGTDGFKNDTGSTGKVYVFTGGPSLDSIADYDYSLNRNQDDLLGQSIASGVDLNGDGYHDILAGMPGNNDIQEDAGAIVLLTGSASVDVDSTINGSISNEQLGQSCAFWAGYQQSDNIVVAAGAPDFSDFRGRVLLYRETVQPLEPTCGDANRDGLVNIGDPVFLINYIFKGGLSPDPVCVADANGDGNANIGDPVHLINYIFKGGSGPDTNCCP